MSEEQYQIYRFEAQAYQGRPFPNEWQKETISASKFEIDQYGNLCFYRGSELVASYAAGRWQRVEKSDK